MRFPQMSRAVVRRISLTPLIDIVFILLLFFILESNFLQFGELVFSAPQQEQPGSSRLRAIEIQVFEDGRIWFDGRTHDTATLGAYLADKNYDSQTPVVVRAHFDLPVQLLVRVVDVLQINELYNQQIVPLED